MEKVWFDEAVTCRSRADIGIPATPDESIVLEPEDTIASVQRAHCWRARRPGPHLPRSVSTTSCSATAAAHSPCGGCTLHMLRELAQHCGHADLLREQVTRD